MIHIMKADESHVEGISSVCTRAYWATYGETHSKDYIERVVNDFYNHARILREVTESNRNWGGYFVALENGVVVGAGGGGMIADEIGELFVLYLDPARRNEGIGTKLLDVITKQQKNDYGATKQWVSVQKGNMKGVPFYEAKGFTFQHEKVTQQNPMYVKLRYAREI
ncbi:GNAT family N-acetyltransferase [Thalassobacillus sp. CUG 92003]|uniref:GNAT family N-acetyltransferase n=1 Tax=Thalassobacillus sp. CUG 92003 TaxID=2736641 RepID=UPI0015E74A8E|nr:GNAT family N-acetyltransferase [Thalassobacillus sp. CUG 92003]